MNALVAKEIRLLLPAFILALLLSIVPVWFFTAAIPNAEFLSWTFPLVCFGGLMLALTSFGREFEMGTFPLLLSLPLSRSRIWWIKIAVLACALAVVFGVFWCSMTLRCSLAGVNGVAALYEQWARTAPIYQFSGIHGTAIIATAFATTLASGLWTTLLLRQMMGAFWFAVLVPGVVLTLILWNGGTALTSEVVLGAYSMVGFGWAWRQFYRAQEVAWTGGEINLPDWQSAGGIARATGRVYRPLAALIGKEIRLYQVALAGMAGLFVLHLGVVVVRKATHGGPDFSVLSVLLGMFGGIWLLVPLITGSLNVADERRLGTLEGQLCLPVSTRKQFTIKLLVVLLFSGFLSALLLWTAEGIGSAIGAGGGLGGIKISPNGEGLLTLLAVFRGLSLFIFYASTLTRSILQAMVVAVVIGLALWFAWAFAHGITDEARRILGVWLWGEPLLSFITWPIMIATIIGLSYHNYSRLSETRRLWFRNVRGLILAMVFAGTVTALIFNRTWELLMPLEPPHGVARLSTSQPPVLHSHNRSFSVLLPDGRLWSERFVFGPGRKLNILGENLPIPLGNDEWVVEKGNRFVEGSNWVAAAEGSAETIGIRSDGTLWVSETPSHWHRAKNGQVVFPPAAKMIRYGNESDWKSVIGDNHNYDAIILLKTDGTLWRWGSNHVSIGFGQTRLQPHQLGRESDWSDVLSSSLGMFVWKSDGRAWKFNFQPRNDQPSQAILEPNLTLERWETFDHIKWRSLAGSELFQLAVREDGTLWTFGEAPTPADSMRFAPILLQTAPKQPVQIGTARDWIAVAGGFGTLVALKADGTLWKWTTDYYRWDDGRNWPLARPPTRLGTHHDWVAISGDAIVTSLAADGSIWHWTDFWSSLWLAPSRKPEKFDDIFAQQ